VNSANSFAVTNWWGCLSKCFLIWWIRSLPKCIPRKKGAY